MSNKILVTGGAGYIGSHVVKLLAKNNYDVVIFDNLSTGNAKAVTSGELIVGDLSDVTLLNDVFKKHDFIAVMHFAGSIVVPESVANPAMYYSNNTVNSLNLINTCVQHGVDKFIFSSTAAVYGALTDGVATEDTATVPINPYGHSKLMTEQMLKDTSAAHDFNFIALRYFNVSGADPEGQIGQAFPGATHLIKVNCEAAVGKREKTQIFGDTFNTPDGTGVRDYIHVTDLASAHVCALDYLLKNKNQSQILNCGYGKGYSVKEVIAAVKKVSGVDYPVELAPARQGDPASVIANADRIKKILAWSPKFDNLETIVRTAFEWENGDILKNWKNA